MLLQNRGTPGGVDGASGIFRRFGMCVPNAADTSRTAGSARNRRLQRLPFGRPSQRDHERRPDVAVMRGRIPPASQPAAAWCGAFESLGIVTVLGGGDGQAAAVRGRQRRMSGSRPDRSVFGAACS